MGARSAVNTTRQTSSKLDDELAHEMIINSDEPNALAIQMLAARNSGDDSLRDAVAGKRTETMSPDEISTFRALFRFTLPDAGAIINALPGLIRLNGMGFALVPPQTFIRTTDDGLCRIYAKRRGADALYAISNGTAERYGTRRGDHVSFVGRPETILSMLYRMPPDTPALEPRPMREPTTVVDTATMHAVKASMLAAYSAASNPLPLPTQQVVP